MAQAFPVQLVDENGFPVTVNKENSIQKTVVPVPASNNFMNPAQIQTGVFINPSGGLSNTTTSFAVFTGTWGSNIEFVGGNNEVQFSMFSIAQYNSSGIFIAGTYQGTDNVLNPQKHIDAITFKVTIRVDNVKQLNWGEIVLPYDDYSPASSYQVAESDMDGNPLVFKANLKDEDLLNTFSTTDDINISIRQTSGIDGYRNILEVKKDGSGDEINLMTAMASIIDASPSNKYLVQVFDNHIGVVSSDFTIVPSHQTYHDMLHVKDSVKVIGMGEIKLIHSELPTNSTKTEFETHETCHMEGSSEVENLYFRAKYTRYPLHIDHANTPFNQNSIIKLIRCIFEHLGSYGIDPATKWSATDAVGIGTAAGFHLEALGCVFIGDRYAFRAHTTYSSALPDHFLFDSCIFSSKTADGVAINLDNIGCQQKRFVEIKNCELNGTFVVPSTIDPANTLINKAFPSIQIKGSGNTPFQWINAQNIGSVLKITSNTTGTASYIQVVQDDAGLFGNTVDKTGSLGLSGYIYGDNELISAGTNKSNIIGNRLGDCSTINKLLILNIDGTNRTVIFNQNYGGGTTNPLIDSNTILSEINTELSGFATAEYYQVNLDYYPELSDVLSMKGNTSVTNYIPKGSAIKNVGLNRCRIATTDEIPDGFSIDNIPVSSTPIQLGRIIKNCIVLKTDRFCPLFESGSDTFVEGDCFKISVNGKLLKDTTVKDSFAKAVDSTRIFIK